MPPRSHHQVILLILLTFIEIISFTSLSIGIGSSYYIAVQLSFCFGAWNFRFPCSNNSFGLTLNFLPPYYLFPFVIYEAFHSMIGKASECICISLWNAFPNRSYFGNQLKKISVYISWFFLGVIIILLSFVFVILLIEIIWFFRT